MGDSTRRDRLRLVGTASSGHDPAAGAAAAASADADAEQVIDRLYEVAVDPSRLETLLDRWEAMMRPRRGLADDPGLHQFDAHVLRAGKVLDRSVLDAEATGPEAVLARIDRSAAFAIDAELTVTHVTTAAASVLGISAGVRLADVALGDGGAAQLMRQCRLLLSGANRGPVLLRSRATRTDRVVVLTLRLVQPEAGPAFMVAITSELGWPEGFSEMLRDAFDLTPTEITVVRGLAEGHSLPDIAAARDRSIATVRAQLKAIMAKTETRSQTELVRLTLSSMETVQLSGVSPQPEPSSTGFATLQPRPFQSLMLADGRRLDYLILGDPEGRPCLYFPLGFGLVRWPASAEAEAARRGIKVIVPVRPGYGQSTPLPRDAAVMRQIPDDLAALLDHLGCDRLPLLSLGDDSLLAIAFHAAHPGRCTALIACAGVLPLTRPEQYERMAKWHRFILASARYTPTLLPFMVKAGFAMVRQLGKPGFVDLAYAESPADLRTFQIPEVREALVCGSEVALSDSHSAHEAFAREVTAQEAEAWHDRIAALAAIPVHFLNGLQDPQVPPETLEDYRRKYPWIGFRSFPEAGQLLFFKEWRNVLPLLEIHLE